LSAPIRSPLPLLLQRCLARPQFRQAIAHRLAPCSVLDGPQHAFQGSIDVSESRIQLVSQADRLSLVFRYLVGERTDEFCHYVRREQSILQPGQHPIFNPLPQDWGGPRRLDGNAGEPRETPPI
jgi:hypothetical protein